jgi:hypothetical protein
MPNRYALMLAYALSALLLSVPLQSARAAKPDFNGAWSVTWCDKAKPDRDCGGFSLYLVQEADRICGEHQVATVGLGRLDEGQPGTVLGTVSGNKATVVIEATRSGAKYLATAERSGNRIKWRLVGMVNAGEFSESTIIPYQAVLVRNVQPDQIAHFQAVKNAPCRWVDESGDLKRQAAYVPSGSDCESELHADMPYWNSMVTMIFWRALGAKVT